MRKIDNKGFTLIELLIVIAIIGILAMDLVPSILGGPALARDAQRRAAVADIAEAMALGMLDGEQLPGQDGAGDDCVDSDNFANFLTQLGGAVPVDPTLGDTTTAYGCENGLYGYAADPNGDGSYRYALWTQLENDDTGEENVVSCASIGTAITANTFPQSTVDPTGDDDVCYYVVGQ